jgi:putative tryptophan/tyrosine transport system substrate-binding protein
MYRLSIFIFIILLSSCSLQNKKQYTIGFLDLLQDETLAEAKKGFYDALEENGIDESNTTFIYRNAQNEQPVLLQACDYIISQKPDLIATNPTLSTITAVQRNKTIPVFMMVSPRPDIAGLTDKSGKYPANLFGTYETLDYIDTAMSMVSDIMPDAKRIGTIFNQSEPQSTDALQKIEDVCRRKNLLLIKLPVNNSAETQLVVQSLLSQRIDAFFALPDNTVFSSMETIVKSCDDAKVPVFTCEEGLVKRGAVAGFGADMYQWGRQSGQQAALFLKNKSAKDLSPEIVNARRKVYNGVKATQFGITFDQSFTKVN